MLRGILATLAAAVGALGKRREAGAQSRYYWVVAGGTSCRRSYDQNSESLASLPCGTRVYGETYNGVTPRNYCRDAGNYWVYTAVYNYERVRIPCFVYRGQLVPDNGSGYRCLC